MSDTARAELNAKAANNPANFVLVDIRSEHPGGEWPLFGALKLRSFNRILDFVAEDGSGVQEYDVAKDPRTGEVDFNPARALAIEITEGARRRTFPTPGTGGVTTRWPTPRGTGQPSSSCTRGSR